MPANGFWRVQSSQRTTPYEYMSAFASINSSGRSRLAHSPRSSPAPVVSQPIKADHRKSRTNRTRPNRSTIYIHHQAMCVRSGCSAVWLAWVDNLASSHRPSAGLQSHAHAREVLLCSYAARGMGWDQRPTQQHSCWETKLTGLHGGE